MAASLVVPHRKKEKREESSNSGGFRRPSVVKSGSKSNGERHEGSGEERERRERGVVETEYC